MKGRLDCIDSRDGGARSCAMESWYLAALLLIHRPMEACVVWRERVIGLPRGLLCNISKQRKRIVREVTDQDELALSFGAFLLFIFFFFWGGGG